MANVARRFWITIKTPPDAKTLASILGKLGLIFLDPLDPAIADALASLGADGNDADDGVRRAFARSCRTAHRVATQRHRARVVVAARAAYEAGLDEAATLELVRQRHEDWVSAVRADASVPDVDAMGELPRA